MYLKDIAAATIATLLTAGCGYSIKTATDYNRSVAFSDYHTFFFVKGNSSGNLLLDQRVTEDVEAALASKGWIAVPQGEGRAAVVVHAATKTKHSYETFYDGWGGWQWRWEGSGGTTTFVQDYKVGTVVVDIFDADTKEAIWRGSASDALSDNQKNNSKATERAVTKMFSKFPPPLLLAAGGNVGNAQIRNGPSKIFFAESPAILILIDGDPVYRSVEGTDLVRIINTKALIVRDSGGLYYLKVLDGWMEAYTLTGDWLVSGVAPSGKEALQRVIDAKLVDLLDGEGSQARAPRLEEQAPAIYVSLEPAELITSDGPAQYKNVDGTSLEYLANTAATVFKEPTDQELYVLVSGRWFRAWTTDGPWQFIPSNELPADIAKMADTSPKKNVKSPIAGLAPQGQ